MDIVLDRIAVRVLGTLIEKEVTTPDYYPLSLNALINGCNQKTNREPVLQLGEREVAGAIDTLKEKRLVWQRSVAGARVYKYEHNLRSLFTFTEQEIAVICVLMLRGPQTVGEIRLRTERLCSFGSIEEAEKTVRGLISRSDGPFVVEFPRGAGRKEPRFMHLFSGEQGIADAAAALQTDTLIPEASTGDERLRDLEEEVGRLREELGTLREEFEDFKKMLG